MTYAKAVRFVGVPPPIARRKHKTFLDLAGARTWQNVTTQILLVCLSSSCVGRVKQSHAPDEVLTEQRIDHHARYLG